MSKIVSFTEESMRLKCNKSICLGGFSIFADGNSIEEAQIYVSVDNDYINRNLYDLINALLNQLFKRNNQFKEVIQEKRRVDINKILNTEFSFYVYEYRNERFIEYFPKVGDVLITVLLSYTKQRF